ncbi:MAG: hypothetical protein ABW189_08205, partial [Rickettsiales bacterium]
ELPEHVFFASEKKNLFAVRLKSESMNRMAPNGSFLIVDGNATDDMAGLEPEEARANARLAAGAKGGGT